MISAQTALAAWAASMMVDLLDKTVDLRPGSICFGHAFSDHFQAALLERASPGGSRAWKKLYVFPRRSPPGEHATAITRHGSVGVAAGDG
jgi:hypothetical protein